MAQILAFPSFSRAVPPVDIDDGQDDCADLPTTSGRRCEYAVGDLARILGIAHFCPRTVIQHLRAKAAHDGMPLPKTPRLRGGRPLSGPARIWLHSRWDAERFDGWFDCQGDDPFPPASAALRDRLARRAADLCAPGRGALA